MQGERDYLAIGQAAGKAQLGFTISCRYMPMMPCNTAQTGFWPVLTIIFLEFKIELDCYSRHPPAALSTKNFASLDYAPIS